MKLIFAQGNPEPDYTKSRHNIGFLVLNSLAEKNNTTWSNKLKFKAMTTELEIAGEKVILAKPTTYYNESGTSLRKIIDFYKLDPKMDLLVIHDELALPFGTVRIRQQGSDGGNNGIKSINSHVDPTYKRIRIGIANELNEKIDDATFVLSKFNSNEFKQLEKSIVPHVIDLIDQFCLDNLSITSYKNI